jgi:hypothetical protein
MIILYYSVKKLSIFPSPAGMALTKLSLAGNNSIIPGHKSLVSDIPARDRKMYNIFFTVYTGAGNRGQFSTPRTVGPSPG